MQWYQIVLSDYARKELDAIRDHILWQLENPIAAINTVKGIRKTIDTLKLFPLRHEVTSDEKLSKLGVRYTYWKNYKVSYIVDEQEIIVYIIHITHMSVDTQKKLYDTLKIREAIRYGQVVAMR